MFHKENKTRCNDVKNKNGNTTGSYKDIAQR